MSQPSSSAGPDGDIEIADRDKDCWEWSNTRTLIRVVSERNRATGGRFVPQTRMAKTFATVAPGLDVCGLVSESIAFDAVATQVSDQEALLNTFFRGAGLTTGTLTDPTGVDDLLDGWGYERRQAAASVFAGAAIVAKEALDYERAEDEDSAIHTWGTLLGEQFPAPRNTSNTHKLMTSWNTGGLTSGNRITPVAAAAAQPVRTVRSHRQP